MLQILRLWIGSQDITLGFHTPSGIPMGGGTDTDR